jgi:hypothetical protein
LKRGEKNLTKKIFATALRKKKKRVCATLLTESKRARNLVGTRAVGRSCEHNNNEFEARKGGKIFSVRNMRRLFCCAVGAGFFFLSLPARALDEIPPPFGFKWNDLTGRVETLLKGAKARIVSREKKENNEVWTVEGLVQPGLQRTLFTFREGFLVAVELQYEYPDWTIERYNERMGEIRRYFDAKFGTGKLVSRSRDTDTDVIQTLVGYQWMIGSTMLELFYFSAQRDALLFRMITVDYKMI